MSEEKVEVENGNVDRCVKCKCSTSALRMEYCATCGCKCVFAPAVIKRASTSFDSRLRNHMSRLGAGLQILKVDCKAPLEKVLSYPDRVGFTFEGDAYQITRVHQPELNLEDKNSGEMQTKASSLSQTAIPQVSSLDADQPCSDPRCNDTLGAMPIPQCVTAVAWAEEAAKVADALRGILNVIEADDLIPESVSYMRQARNVMTSWPEIPELALPRFPITQDSASPKERNSTTVPDESSLQHQTESSSEPESRDDRSSVLLPSDVQKKIAEIRERRAKHTNYHRDPYQTVAQQGVDIDFLLSIIFQQEVKEP